MKLNMESVREAAKTTGWGDWRSGCYTEIFLDISDGQDLTEQEYADLVWFWETEVSAHNDGEYTEMFGDYDGTSILFEYD